MENEKKYQKLVKELLYNDLKISPYPLSQYDRIDKFSKMVLDDQVSASLFSRMSKSVNQNIQIESENKQVREFLLNELKNLKDSSLYDILSCIIYGFSVMEVIYEKKGDFVGLKNLILKNPKNFKRSSSGDFIYRSNDLNISKIPNKFIISVYLPNFQNVNGSSALMSCYYYYEFKKLGWTNWSKAFSRLANPMVLLLMEQDFVLDDEKALKSLVSKIESGSSMFLQGIKDTKILSDPSGIEAPKVFIEECNKAISRSITGTTMITNTPQYGTHSLGKIQNENFYNYIKLDKSVLKDSLQILVNNLVDLNFPNEKANVIFDDEKGLSLQEYIDLYKAGIPFDLDQMFDKFNIKKKK